MITNIMQNTIHDNDAMIPATNNTAISLWHKFATWQNDMDQCRKMVRTICDEQDRIRMQMKDLLVVREEERRKIKEMEETDSSANASSDSSEQPSFELLRVLQRKLDDVEEQYRTASASLEATKQKYQNQTHSRQEILREFINASRSFHLKCQRMQYDQMETAIATTQNAEHIEADTNETLGTLCRVHTLHAALCAKSIEDTSGSSGNTIHDVDELWISKTIEDLQHCIALHKTTMIDYQESSNEHDPSTWKVWKENDFELHRAVELYTQQRTKCDIAEKEMEQLQSKYDALHEKGLDRDRRMMKLQTQLQRIQDDCTTIESEIDQCHELTMEDEALAHTYRAKIDQRNQLQSKNNAHRRIALNHVDPISFEKLPTQQRPSTLASLIPPLCSTTPSTASTNPTQGSHGVHNPYATSRKRSVEAARDIHHVDSNHRRQDLASIVLGRPMQPHSGTIISTTPKEHDQSSRKNHRRRVYRHRWEFGCSLGIGTTTTDTCDDAIAQGTTSFNVPTPDCLDGDTAGGAAQEPLASSYTPPVFDPSTYDTENVNVPDDDDDLLSFVAFPTSQGRFAS